MKPCTRFDLNVTWRCQWRCRHCFYLRSPSFHAQQDEPLTPLLERVDCAKAAGYDHAVMTGFGEPSLCRHALEIVQYCRERDIAVSMITNGATKLRYYQNLVALGIDHLHLSSHGIGDVLDDVAQARGAYRKQQELKDWLASEGLPYRANLSLQQANYLHIMPALENDLEHGVYHYVLLGFLPHYEWAEHVAEVAVPPAELRPCIEQAAELLEVSGVYWTIRYHPLCHLDARWWPHVTNARYVFYDPWEWNHTLNIRDDGRLWRDAVNLGESVAIQGKPCSDCVARRHCGGWNRTYAAAFSGAGLRAIREVPDVYRDVWDRDGGLHDLNPANALTGTIREARPSPMSAASPA